MSTRRLMAWTAVYVFAGLAVLGLLLFTGGLVIEFLGLLDKRPLSESLSPTMQVALTGLCLSSIMALFGFVLVGVLLARQTRRLAPGYGEAYKSMTQFQFNQAIPVLERAVRTGHETPDILMLLTNAYAYSGQFGKAQATADRAVQLFPHDAGAYLSLANGYRLQASYDEAARALQRAAELAPTEPVVWAELAFVQQLAGDDAAADVALKEAARYPMPPMYSVRVNHHLAQTYRKAGDIDQAMLAASRMISAREGLEAWKPMQQAMEGTVYGQRLRYEIAAIEEAIQQADAATSGRTP